MMKRTLILMLVMLVISCKENKEVAPKPATPQSDTKMYPGYKIDSEGKSGAITNAMTKEDLISKFGKENVEDETILIEEGSVEVKTTVLFKDTENELRIIWNEKGNPKKLWFENIGAKWDVYGTKVGMELKWVTAINGISFQFNGFGWDRGGVVTNWNGGDLGRIFKNGTVTLGFDFERAEQKNIDLDKFMGDGVKLSSDDQNLIPLDIRVSKIELVF